MSPGPSSALTSTASARAAPPPSNTASASAVQNNEIFDMLRDRARRVPRSAALGSSEMAALGALRAGVA
jgi:hypothetical protein